MQLIAERSVGFFFLKIKKGQQGYGNAMQQAKLAGKGMRTAVGFSGGHVTRPRPMPRALSGPTKVGSRTGRRRPYMYWCHIYDDDEIWWIQLFKEIWWIRKYISCCSTHCQVERSSRLVLCKGSVQCRPLRFSFQKL